MEEARKKFCSQCGQPYRKNDFLCVCGFDLTAEQKQPPESTVSTQKADQQVSKFQFSTEEIHTAKPSRQKWMLLSIGLFGLIIMLCVATLLLMIPSPEEVALQRLAEAEIQLERSRLQAIEARERLAILNEQLGDYSPYTAQAADMVFDRLGEPVFDLRHRVFEETGFLLIFFDEGTGAQIDIQQGWETQVFPERIVVYEEDLDKWIVVNIRGVSRHSSSVLEVIIAKVE